MVMKLSELRPGMENKDLKVKIVDLHEPRVVESNTGYEHTIVEGTVKDETDKLDLTVWNEKIEEEMTNISKGDRVLLKNTFITSFKGDLAVNVGRDSSITKL